LEEHGIDYREYRSVRSYSQSEREDGSSRETGAAAQNAEGVTGVIRKIFDQLADSHVIAPTKGLRVIVRFSSKSKRDIFLPA
jgi:hypothetical protein